MNRNVKKGAAHIGKFTVRTVFLCGRVGVKFAKYGFKIAGVFLGKANSNATTFAGGGGGTPIADEAKGLIASALQKLDNGIKNTDRKFNRWSNNKISRI